MFVSTEEIIKQYICRFSADIENDEEIKQDNHVKQELKKIISLITYGCRQSNSNSELHSCCKIISVKGCILFSLCMYVCMYICMHVCKGVFKGGFNPPPQKKKSIFFLKNEGKEVERKKMNLIVNIFWGIEIFLRVGLRYFRGVGG